jgi:hypothetical protein
MALARCDLSTRCLGAEQSQQRTAAWGVCLYKRRALGSHVEHRVRCEGPAASRMPPAVQRPLRQPPRHSRHSTAGHRGSKAPLWKWGLRLRSVRCSVCLSVFHVHLFGHHLDRLVPQTTGIRIGCLVSDRNKRTYSACQVRPNLSIGVSEDQANPGHGNSRLV